MKIDFASEKPIFLQISEGIEDSILSGAIEENGQIPSTTEFAMVYKINPATANKGINMLVDKGILYKRRGVGMFVAEGALEKLRLARSEQFKETYVENLVDEARRLGLTPRDVIEMIERSFEK